MSKNISYIRENGDPQGDRIRSKSELLSMAGELRLLYIIAELGLYFLFLNYKSSGKVTTDDLMIGLVAGALFVAGMIASIIWHKRLEKVKKKSI